MNILLVDDFKAWRTQLRSFLEKHPRCKVVGEAADGMEGIQKAQQLQPDLILLDIGMPRLNGLAAFERIRKASPKSKIIFVSVEQSAEFEEAAMKTGAKGYVAKAEVASKLLPLIEALGLKK